MRRKDREITSFDVMTEILKACDCVRLGFADCGSVYIVPMNFGFDASNEKLTLYLHGDGHGRRASLIGKGRHIGFETDTAHHLIKGKNACDYSFRYQSIIGEGDISFITDKDKKVAALTRLMAHFTETEADSFSPAFSFDKDAVERTSVMALSVTDWSCKEHLLR